MKNKKRRIAQAGAKTYLVSMTDADYVNETLDEIGICHEIFSEYLMQANALGKKDSVVYYLHRFVMRIVTVDYSEEEMEDITTIPTSSSSMAYCYDLDRLLALLKSSKYLDVYRRWMIKKLEPHVARKQ